MAGNLNPLGIDDYHDLTSADGWRGLRANYFANVTLVDRQVGKMLDALRETGQWDNTIIVFTSEHGEMAGDHGMLEKRSMYEEASRVPLLMRIPGLGPDTQRATQRIAGSVSLVDLVPTLLDISGTGTDAAPELQGRSLAPVIDGYADLSDNDVFVQWNGMGDRNLGTAEINRMASMPWRTVITSDRWKLNLCATDRSELYDLNNDPARVDQPLRCARASRPRPRHGSAHKNLAGRNRRHRRAASSVTHRDTNAKLVVV